MAGVRKREQPGTVPGLHRRYARGGGGDSPESVPAAGNGTLACSVTAMAEALRRLAAASATDVPRAIAAATEAVWWITAVDAAMNRRHPGEYRRALAALDPAARRAIEGSLTGLRFISRPARVLCRSRRLHPAARNRQPAGPVDLDRRPPADPAARIRAGRQPLPGVPGPARRAASHRDPRTGSRLPLPGPPSRPRGGHAPCPVSGFVARCDAVARAGHLSMRRGRWR